VYADNDEDLRDQNNMVLVRILRERVRQMCALSFNDPAVVCTVELGYSSFNLFVYG